MTTPRRRPARAARPTDFELDVLKILWEHGPSSARAILDRIFDRRPVGYTTVLKICQLMEQKGMVAVDRSARSHVYAPRLKREPTLRRLVGDFVDAAFDGAADEAVLHLVRSRALDPEVLADLHRRITEARRQESHRDDA